MPPLSDLDHYKLDAEVLGDGNEVVNYEYVTNVRLGLRNAKFEQRWYRQANLGQNSSSDVWLEIQKGNPESKRAVKALSKRRLLENKVDYRRELKALTEFSKPKYRQKGVFVDFHGWWDNHDSVFLAMEYFPAGNLEDNILSGPPGPPGPLSTYCIMFQLLEGLEIMHAEGFAHRDLKPANIFVVQKDPMWWVKIGDFGISKRIQNQDTSLRTYTGTHDYMAPEFFGYGDVVDEERSDYTHAVDLWALGCVVYRLYTGKVPFPSYPNLRPLQRYCSGETAPSKKALQSTGCPDFLVVLIMDLLSPGPYQRPSANFVLGAMSAELDANTLMYAMAFRSSDLETVKADHPSQDDEYHSSQMRHDPRIPYDKDNALVLAIEAFNEYERINAQRKPVMERTPITISCTFPDHQSIMGKADRPISGDSNDS